MNGLMSGIEGFAVFLFLLNFLGVQLYLKLKYIYQKKVRDCYEKN